ncbi:hypothetical protein [Micrococcus porci]|uniref:hypothetical protein n=1 Tax=Micrococcus porci TaxID=2856555 RepID=UPI003CE7AA31
MENKASAEDETLPDGLADVRGVHTDGWRTAEQVRDFREQLGDMSPERVAVLAALAPGSAAMIPGWPSAPEELRKWPTAAEGRAWWDSRSPAQQKAMLQHFPGVVGSTEGIDYGTRDEANRAALESALTPEQRQALETIKSTVVDPAATDRIGRGPDGRPRQLIQLQDIHARQPASGFIVRHALSPPAGFRWGGGVALGGGIDLLVKSAYPVHVMHS